MVFSTFFAQSETPKSSPISPRATIPKACTLPGQDLPPKPGEAPSPPQLPPQPLEAKEFCQGLGFLRDDRVILGLHRDNGKENGNYKDYRGYIRVIYCGDDRVILGLYRDNGKENGNYYNGEANGKEHGKCSGNWTI